MSPAPARPRMFTPGRLPAAKTRTTRWTASETGGIPATQFAEPELVKWKTFDGKEITGFLYKPDAAKFPGPRPVIINIHGGRKRNTVRVIWAEQLFHQRARLRDHFPERARLGGYGKTFLKLDNGFKREDSYKDISALLDWIPSPARAGCRQGNGDRRFLRRIHDAGGGVELRRSNPLRARRGRHSNFATFLKNTESYRRDLRRVEYGDERDPKMAEFLERIAPLNNAQKITKPLFVVQGRKRSARAENGSGTNRGDVKEAEHAGLVSDGERRRARFRQEEERRLPVLQHRPVHAGVSPEVDGQERGILARSCHCRNRSLALVWSRLASARTGDDWCRIRS